ncbi:MAG: FimV/HubP family polar landmark protein [Chromatiales bacterium]|jgi:pilus assembly protein FimV
MLRKLPLAMAIALAVSPLQLQALGLGKIEARSVLNQPFDADIELLSVAPGELDSVKVGLASAQAFARAGVERPFSLSRLKFSTERKPNGEAIVHVYSNTLIQEPYLNFLVEVNWPKGRLVREFTVLLDPPLTTGKKTPAAINAPQATAPASRSSAASQRSTAPTTGRASASATVAPDQYGPVKRNETLWGIADRFRGQGVSVQQMMLAILQANPQAFSSNNINTLKAGTILRIPTADEATQISQRQALAAAADQYRDWKNDNLQESTAPAGEKKMPAAGEPSTDAAEQARLKLSGADRSSSAMGTGADSDAESIKQELLTAQEKIVTSQTEADALRGQVGEMQQQIADMQRLLELKDEQLARLQSVTSGEPGAMEEAVGESMSMPSEETVEVGQPEAEAVAESMEPAPIEIEEAPAEPTVAAPPPDEPAMPAAAKEKGLLDVLMGSATMMGIAIAVVIVLLALIWTALSRRKSNEQLTPVQGLSSAPEPSGKTEADVLNTVVEEPEEESSFLSEFTPGDMNALHDDETGEVDPISEADVYIAYGRFDQAEDLVKQALDAEPGKVAYQHKLLEIYYANKDRDKYTALMEEMQNAGAEAQDPDSWNRAKLMGLDLDPENPMFADAMDAPSMDIGDDLDLALSELESQLTEDIDNPLEDLHSSGDVDDFLAKNEPAESDTVEEASAQSEDVTAPTEEDVIPLPEVELDTSAMDTEEDDSAIDELAAELESLELDNAPASELVLDAPVGEELPDDEDLVLSEDSGDLSDFASELDESDSVSTKIDLAKAYIDMGDKEGAKGILEEVLEEGSDAQKQQAQTMIAEMG